MSLPRYVGRELDLFAQAGNWKRYWSSFVVEHLRGDVLEAGAGIGANTALLKMANAVTWTCLEPDASLAEQMHARFAADPKLRDCRIRAGTVESLKAEEMFDAILYIDVLEHIADDQGELRRAAGHLRAEGSLIVLSPAYSWLFSPFDRAIGHLRRYHKSTLRACAPENCRLQRMIYLDSAGLLASAANRLLLKQSMPTLRQILFWNAYLVPVSRLLDRVVLHSFGKSLLGIWRKL